MDIRSIRMLLGWSREELAKQSGVSFASVYLLERMGAAGPRDDLLITRTLLEAHRRRSRNLLFGNDAVPLEHATDDTAVMPAAERRAPPERRDEQPPKVPLGHMDQRPNSSSACPSGQTTPPLEQEPCYVDGLSRR